MGNYRLSDALVRDPANADNDVERLLQMLEVAVLAQASPAVLGAVADAGVTGDTAGTLSAKARGLNTVIGATADAAVDSDANGSLKAHIRGLVKIFANVWNSTVGFLRVGFNADLQNGVNKHVAVTLTVAETDYTVDIPDNARFITMYATDTFRYGMGEAPATPAATKAGNTATTDYGVGGRFAFTGQPITHVLPAGAGRVLHLRSATAALVINIQVA